MRDPGLPVKLGACSNGEVAPARPSPVVVEAVRRAGEACLATADRLGMDRRRFLRSSMASAITLLALNACSKEANDAARGADEGAGSTSSTPGGAYDVPTTATTEPEAAVGTLGGTEVVVDVQNHFLEFDLSTPGGLDFGADFPQASCGDADARACFTADMWRSLVFERSDTAVAVLSAIPVVDDPDPLSIEAMDEARRSVEQVCGDGRVLVQGHAVPNLGDPAAWRDQMLATAAQYDLAAWKVYTHVGPGFRLDDGNPDGMQVGNAFLDVAVESGVPVVAVHKGFSSGSSWASPVDIGPTAAARPEVTLVVYHSGYEASVVERAHDPNGGGVDRLVRSLADAGVAPGANVYAELGSTWWSLMGDPDQAAHLLGKLLLAVGPERILWGTDSIWYGSPQDQIQAFRAFTISDDFQERHGYPALTDDVKSRILGGNAMALFGIEPVEVCRTPAQAEDVRMESPPDRLLGPQTAAAARSAFAREHPWY